MSDHKPVSAKEREVAKAIFDIMDSQRVDDRQAMVSGDPTEPSYESTLIDGFIDLIDLARRLMEAVYLDGPK